MSISFVRIDDRVIHGQAHYTLGQGAALRRHRCH